MLARLNVPAGSWLVLAAQDAQVFFITIAVLLGTGILGLPVKLVYCGFWPFAAVFTFTLFMQVRAAAAAPRSSALACRRHLTALAPPSFPPSAARNHLRGV